MNLLDRLKQIKTGVAHLDQVLASRWNAELSKQGALAKDKKDEAERRYGICIDCPFMSINARTSPEYKALTGNHLTTAKDEEPYCAMCFCPIEYKVLSMDAMCGLNQWNNSHPDKFIPPKWLSYSPDR